MSSSALRHEEKRVSVLDGATEAYCRERAALENSVFELLPISRSLLPRPSESESQDTGNASYFLAQRRVWVG